MDISFCMLFKELGPMEKPCPLFDLLVFTNLHRMLVNPKMYVGTSQVSGSKYKIDSSSISCNTNRWNFIDLADKEQPNWCGLPN